MLTLILHQHEEKREKLKLEKVAISNAMPAEVVRRRASRSGL